MLTTTPLQWLQKCCFDKNVSWCTKQTHSARNFAVLKNALRGLLLRASQLASSSAKLDSLENN